MSLTDKRTQAQLDFDYAKHGWAFCNKPMLLGKIERLEEIAKTLSIDDKRHMTLKTIKATVETC
jgi:hypothetical protein